MESFNILETKDNLGQKVYKVEYPAYRVRKLERVDEKGKKWFVGWQTVVELTKTVGSYTTPKAAAKVMEGLRYHFNLDKLVLHARTGL